MHNVHDRRQPEDRPSPAVEELRQIRQEIRKLRETLDAFAGVLLNAAYPYGKATDRWGRRE